VQIQQLWINYSEFLVPKDEYVTFQILINISNLEEKMKNILQIILITFFTFAISSCAKKDDSKTATAIPAAGTGTTASGTLTHPSGQEFTGTYNMSWSGAEPSGGCIDNSTALTLMGVPTGTVAFKKQFIITSSTKFTNSMQWYSDATCSTLTGYFNTGYNGVEFDSSVAMSLTAGSGPTKPTTATKIKYTEEGYGLMGNTDGTLAYFANIGLTLTSGTEKLVEEESPSTCYSLFNHGTQSGSDSTYLFFGYCSTSYPTDWHSTDTVYWK